MIVLNIYMGFSRFDGAEQGACLIFAHTVKEARKLAFPILQDWNVCDEWIDCAAYRIRDKDYFYRDADQDNLNSGIAHVIESPIVCKQCGLWGTEINEVGICNDCEELDA